MAGEWIGLIGTAIGAGVGATAAVGSLVIRARQEASAEERRYRRDQASRGRERAWDITLSGLDARRAAYISLVEVVAEYEARIEQLEERTDSSRTLEEDDLAALVGDMERLSAMVPTIEMQAQNEAVGPALRALIRHGRSLATLLNESSPSERLTHLEQAEQATHRLRNACRWDLGLNGKDPREHNGELGTDCPEPTRESRRSSDP